MSFATFAEYAFLTITVLVTLALIGLPLRVVFDRLAGGPVDVPVQLLGMGVVVIVSWYWYGAFGGTTGVVRALAVVGAIVAIVVAVRDPARARAALRRSVFPAAVAGAMTLVLVILLGSVLAKPNPTIVTGGNNDVALYALLSQHIADRGIGDPGQIAGVDLGIRAQSDFDFGIMAISAAAGAAGPFRDVWRYQLPLLVIAICQLSFVIARLLDSLAPGRRVLAILAAVAGTSTFLTTYLWSEYFLNQLVAMAMMIAAAGAIARATDQTSWRATASFAAPAAVLVAPLIASYPHLGVIGTAIIVPPLILAAGTHSLRRRGLRAGAVAVGVALGSALVLPRLFLRVVDSLRYLDTVEAGWPLPGFLPAEVFGLVNTVRPRHDSMLEWIPSVLVLAVVGVCGLMLIRHRTASGAGMFVLTFVPLALVSHGVIYLREGGPTYQQWKWLTSFVPLVAASGLFAVLVAADVFVGRTPVGQRGRVVATTGGLAVLAVLVTNSLAVGFGLGSADRGETLEPDTAALAGHRALESLDVVAIDAPAFWETMWLSYFLRDIPSLRLVQPSYFTPTTTPTEWVVQAASRPVPDDAVRVIALNDSYRLVRRAVGDPGDPSGAVQDGGDR
jgi:hypothetical protein